MLPSQFSKRISRAAIALVFAFSCHHLMAQSQPPENLTVHAYVWTNSHLIGWLPFVPSGTPVAHGVWVAVYISDPAVEALSITIAYRDGAGRDLSQRALTERHYRGQAAWTNHLFLLGDTPPAKISSVLIMPLRLAGETKLTHMGAE